MDKWIFGTKRPVRKMNHSLSETKNNVELLVPEGFRETNIMMQFFVVFISRNEARWTSKVRIRDSQLIIGEEK
jgi:dimeric dUTPase (all-alpha-NTP-PPase superfamily)